MPMLAPQFRREFAPRSLGDGRRSATGVAPTPRVSRRSGDRPFDTCHTGTALLRRRMIATGGVDDGRVTDAFRPHRVP
jgi:hypothetical protein